MFGKKPHVKSERVFQPSIFMINMGQSFPFPAFNFLYLHPCYLVSHLLSVMLHHWCYQGFLAFRRRCGETLQDSCCPPGACGPSPNPPPVTLPLPQHPRPEILQDPPRSSTPRLPSSNCPLPSLSLHSGSFGSHAQFSAHLSPTQVCNG